MVRFGKHTLMDEVINDIKFWFDIVYTQRCWWGCKSHSRDIWREDSQNRRATARTYTYIIGKLFGAENIYW